MDTTGIESIDSSYIAAGIGALLLFVSLALLMQGWVMRLCIRLCGGDEVGILYAIAVVICSMLASFVATCCLVAFVAQPTQWAALGCSVAGGVGAIALMAKMDPLRGFGVYLLYSILGSIVTVVFAIMVGVACFALVPADKLAEFAKAGDAYAERAKKITGVIQQNGENSQESGAGAFSLEAQLSSLRGAVDEQLNEQEEVSNKSPSNMRDDKASEGFFGVGAATATETMKQQTQAAGRASQQENANGNKQRAVEAVSPFDGTTRSNPFAVE